MVKNQSAATSVSLHSIGIEAAIWGLPIVSMDAMRQAFLRDAEARHGDVVYWSRPADWKLQLPTPLATAYRVCSHLDTSAGPLVLEIPVADGAGLVGSILDAWQVPAIDVGPAGADGGTGGKYLVLPPGHTAELPLGYIPVRPATFHAHVALRAVPKGPSRAQAKVALALVHQIRIYPLAEAHRPAPTVFIDMAGKLFDGIVRFDLTLYASLARALEEEPLLLRDAAMAKRIEAIGIAKGKRFAPDRIMQAILNQAARDAHTWLVGRAHTGGALFWPDGKWRSPSAVGPRTGHTFEVDGNVDSESRGIAYFLACAPPANMARATLCLTSHVDADDRALYGDRTYRLRVPANVPARQFWTVTVYDAETASFIRNAASVEASSHNHALQRNPDGSLDLYFAHRAPAGRETNWIATAPGRHWFAAFRCHDPEPSILDRIWTLPSIERV